MSRECHIRATVRRDSSPSFMALKTGWVTLSVISILWAIGYLRAEGDAGVVPGAAADVEVTRAIVEKWVEARQQLSRTRSDWEAEREMLQQTRALLQRELALIEAQFGKLDTNTVQVDKERAQAQDGLRASLEHHERVHRFAQGFEKRVNGLVPRFPEPLQELLKPLLARLPPDPANTKMTAPERFQVIVAILNEIDKFNTGLTIASEKRKNDRGEEVAVETVYVGLGAAYFVNDAGDFAGMGTAGPSGWEWTVRNELASTVREMIRIYRNERPARFLSLPAAIR